MSDVRTEEEIEREAADWFTRLHSGEADAATRSAFEAWLHANRAHKIAYREFEQVFQDLEVVVPEAGVDVDTFLGRAKADRLEALRTMLRRPFTGIAAATVFAALAVTGVVAGGLWPPAAQDAAVIAEAKSPEYMTRTAEIREITLEDGSIVTLGPASRMQTEFSGRRRHVVLLEGEAFFEVVRDPARPFFVTSQDTLVRVLGTQFDVKRSADIVHISVLEGVVEVLKPSDINKVIDTGATAAIPKQVLTAGERVSAARRVALPEVKQIEQAEPGAWRRGRLAYEDASLAEIVSDLNRYSERPIEIATSDVGDLRSTISFYADDMDNVLAVITAIHPVKAEREKDGTVTLRRAERR
jgi:transmembrane sensor